MAMPDLSGVSVKEDNTESTQLDLSEVSVQGVNTESAQSDLSEVSVQGDNTESTQLDLSQVSVQGDDPQLPIPEEVEEPSYSLPEHLLEVVPQIGKGIVDGFESTVDAVQDLGDTLNPGYKATSILAGLMYKALMNEAVGDTPLTRNIENGNIGFSEAKTVTGTVVNDISQFLTGLFGGAKLIKATGYVAKTVKAKIGVSAVASGASESVAFETAEQGFTEMLNQYPMFEPFMPDFMVRSEGASNGEIRLKKFIDGLGWGILGDSLFLALKALKAKKHGDIEGAVKLAEEAENNVTAKAAGEEPTVKAEGEPEVKVDGEPTVKAEGETPDANKVLPDEPVEIKNVTVFGEKKIAQLRAAIQEAQSSEDVNAILEGLDLNFDYMTGDDSAKDVINAISEIIAPQIDKIKGGVQTFGEIEQLADILGQNTDVLVQDIKTTYGATANLAAVATAGRILLQKMGKEVSRLSEIVSDPKVATSVHKVEMIQKMKMMAEMVALQKGMQTNIARALASHRIKAGDAFTELTPETLDGIIDAAGGDKELIKLAQNLKLNAGDVRKQVDALEKTWGGKILDVHNEYWINMILSGPDTHLVNMTSALIQSLVVPAERVVGAVLQGDSAAAREGLDHFLGMYQSLWESLSLARAAMKKGDNVLDTSIDTGSRVELTNHSISSRNLKLRENTGMGWLIDGVGTLARTPSRFLLSEDEFFKQMTYRARIRSKAWTEARTKKLNSKEKVELVKKRLAEAFDETGRGIDEDALQLAREVTFTQDLKYGFGKDWQNMVIKYPALRIVSPFVRTPTNILRSVWQHTPGIQMFQKQLKEDLASTGMRRQMALGKIATGYALYTVAGGLAMSGHITGQRPVRQSLAEAKAATGWLPYSFVFEGKDGKLIYIPFGRLDPFGMIFGMMGDVHDMREDLADYELDEMGLAFTAALSRSITSKHYLSGITNMLEAFTSGDPNRMRRLLHTQAGSYVPALISQLNSDPLHRESTVWFDSVKRRISGLSETVMPKRTALGEVIPKMNNALPWRPSVAKDEPVYEELKRLNGPLSKPPEKFGRVNLTEYVNQKGQSAYDRFREIEGSVKLEGRNLKQTLLKEINSSYYKGLPDPVRDFTSLKKRQIRKIAMRFRKEAMRLLENDENFKDKESGVSFKDALDADKKKANTIKYKGLKEWESLVNF